MRMISCLYVEAAGKVKEHALAVPLILALSIPFLSANAATVTSFDNLHKVTVG